MSKELERLPFTDKIMRAWDLIADLSPNPAQAVAICLTIATTLMESQLRAREFKIGIQNNETGAKVFYRVRIDEVDESYDPAKGITNSSVQ